MRWGISGQERLPRCAGPQRMAGGGRARAPPQQEGVAGHCRDQRVERAQRADGSRSAAPTEAWHAVVGRGTNGDFLVGSGAVVNTDILYKDGAVSSPKKKNKRRSEAAAAARVCVWARGRSAATLFASGEGGRSA